MDDRLIDAHKRLIPLIAWAERELTVTDAVAAAETVLSETGLKKGLVPAQIKG